MKKTIKKPVSARVTVYVNNDDGEVISAEKFEELVAAKAADYEGDSGRKHEWLEDEYLSAIDILDMTDEQRTELNARWKEAAAAEARDDLLEFTWTDQEVEVKVEVEVEVEFAIDIKTI